MRYREEKLLFIATVEFFRAANYSGVYFLYRVHSVVLNIAVLTTDVYS